MTTFAIAGLQLEAEPGDNTDSLLNEIDKVMAQILEMEDRGAPGNQLRELQAWREMRDELFAKQQENLVLNHVFKIYSDAGGSMTNP